MMMKFYSIAMVARSNGAFHIDAGLVAAVSEEEAEGKALRLAREKYEAKKGFTDHQAMVVETPERALKLIRLYAPPNSEVETELQQARSDARRYQNMVSELEGERDFALARWRETKAEMRAELDLAEEERTKALREAEEAARSLVRAWQAEGDHLAAITASVVADAIKKLAPPPKPAVPTSPEEPSRG